MENELKACPLCGRKHIIDVDTEFGGVMFIHKNFDWQKDECLLSEQELSDNVPVENFVKLWNTRPIEDKLKAENERLREALIAIRDERDDGIEWMQYIAKKALKEVKE